MTRLCFFITHLGGENRGAAQRTVLVREKPRVDAADVEGVATLRQQPNPFALFEFAQADGAVRAVDDPVSLLEHDDCYRIDI